MFDKLTMHVNGQTSKWGNFTIAGMFAHNVRFQVLCQNQEEKDYLQALCLVYGRQLQIDIWEEWIKPLPSMELNENGVAIRAMGMRRKLLPIVYTTFHVNLRGH